MHTSTLKKLALALTFWLALHMSSLRAQIFTDDLPLQAVTTGTNPVDFEFRSDGTLIAKGNINVGTLLSTDQGAGTRMFWLPSLGAFRAGGIVTTTNAIHDWDLANIGKYSMALGYDTMASGEYSVALGVGGKATGEYSVALSEGSAVGTGAVAINGYAGGYYSLAMGTGSAYGDYSIAFGASTASGYRSTAFGYRTTASGYFSTAMGSYTTASAYLSFVIGSYNVGLSSTGAASSPTTWVPIDPIFEIGNGAAGTASNNYTPTLSDAFVVYKDGSATFQGPVKVAPGGDIPMYTGE